MNCAMERALFANARFEAPSSFPKMVSVPVREQNMSIMRNRTGLLQNFPRDTEYQMLNNFQNT